MIHIPEQEALLKHVNKKLVIFFLLLYVIVPAVLMIPLYDRVSEVEKSQQEQEIQQFKSKDPSVKKVCDKAAKKEASTQKSTSCS